MFEVLVQKVFEPVEFVWLDLIEVDVEFIVLLFCLDWLLSDLVFRIKEGVGLLIVAGA